MEESSYMFGKMDLPIMSLELRQISSPRYRTFWKTAASPLGEGREQIVTQGLCRQDTSKQEKKGEVSRLCLLTNKELSPFPLKRSGLRGQERDQECYTNRTSSSWKETLGMWKNHSHTPITVSLV